MGFKVTEGQNFVYDKSYTTKMWSMHKMLLEFLRSKNVQIPANMVVDLPITLERMTTLEHEQIYLRLKSHVKHTLVFENEDLREKAKSCVPLMLLKEKSTKIFNSKSNLDKDGKKVKSFDHVLLVQLLAWFKREFFSWVDKPKCENCSQPNVLHVGHLPPRQEEKRWQAGVVEGYRCTNCANLLRLYYYQ